MIQIIRLLLTQLHCTASVDFLVVPTLPFKILFVLVVQNHERRQVVQFGVTTNPTAAWTAQQITEAFPWEYAPRFLHLAANTRRDGGGARNKT